ncbi:MAG: sigma-54-dependent transcriptional regulator [Vulcanimicrobiota bacterium]
MTSTDEKEKILVVDDAPVVLRVIRKILSSRGYIIITANSALEAISTLESESIDLVITDYKMPNVSGLDLIRHIRENFKNTEVIMITGYPSIEGAVEAVKTGAEEYLTKPFTGEELLSAVKRVIDKAHLKKAHRGRSTVAPFTPYGLIGHSPAMRALFSNIAKAASSNESVLITGESGTGKELLARIIHYNSLRAFTPFMTINCSMIPEELFESELNGHFEGIIAGSKEPKPEFTHTALHGTIFLKGIHTLSPARQATLLRILHNAGANPQGTALTHKEGVRLISSASRDILSMVRRNTFREDLYFLLGCISIAIPPLRDRKEDILPLVLQGASSSSKAFGRDTPHFTDAAIDFLKNYSWPGNVQELENLIDYAVKEHDSPVIELSTVTGHMRIHQKEELNLKNSLDIVQCEYIQKVLKSVHGNKTKAAEILGVDRKTLRKKLLFAEQNLTEAPAKLPRKHKKVRKNKS